MNIKDIFNKTWDIECIGCAGVSGQMQMPGGIINENKYFQIHQDPEVPLPGFLIINSKRHVKSVSEFTKDELQNLSEIIFYGRKTLEKINGIISVTIIQEERSPHFHVWLFPWYDWMINQFGKISLSNIKPIMKFAEKNLKTEEQLKIILETIDRIKKK